MNQGPAQQGQYQSTILITGSKNDTPSSDLKLKVSQAGIDLFREKVVPEAKACLASTNLDPGCNMAISGTAEGWNHPR